MQTVTQTNSSVLKKKKNDNFYDPLFMRGKHKTLQVGETQATTTSVLGWFDQE